MSGAGLRRRRVTMLLRPALDRTPTTEDALMRRALRQREENPAEGADTHAPAPWSYAARARVRLNALQVVEETLERGSPILGGGCRVE